MAHIKIDPNAVWGVAVDSYEFRELISRLILRTQGLSTDALEDLADLVPSDGSFIVGDGDTWSISTAANVLSELGLVIGSNVQAYSANLTVISALDPDDNYVIIGDGSEWTAETGATLRTSLGLAIGTNVQAWDAGLDDIAALAVTDSNIIVGDGTNWVAESGATARTSIEGHRG